MNRSYAAHMDPYTIMGVKRVLHWHGLLLQELVASEELNMLHVQIPGGHADLRLTSEAITWRPMMATDGGAPIPGPETAAPLSDSFKNREHDLAQLIAETVGSDFGQCSTGYAATKRTKGSLKFYERVESTPTGLFQTYVIDGVIQPTA